MTHRDTNDSLPIDLQRLFPASVSEILRDEDPARFQQWLVQNIHGFATPHNADQFGPQAWRALAIALGSAIWNATPLPSNRFHPRPLPHPGRNDPCACGSGRKFKRCCANAPAFPQFDPQMMWSFVLDSLAHDDLAQALQQDLLPTAAIAVHCATLIHEDHAERAAQLLAPLFAGNLDRRNSQDDEYALDLLLDAYDALGHLTIKQGLLDRIVAQPKRSLLRAAAWQRLATMHLDRGDSPGAWRAFKQAQRDEPEARALAHLELILLAGDGRIDEAPARAKMWIRRLQRKGVARDDELIAWLQDVADDPHETLTPPGFASADDEGELLQGWLSEVRERPITTSYTAVDETTTPHIARDPEQQVRSHLQGLDLSPQQIELVLADLRSQAADASSVADAYADAHADAHADKIVDQLDSLIFTPVASLLDVEQQWHEVFAGLKPFSTHEEPFGDDDPWLKEERWTAFLQQHPQAWDSLDILDDLASALTLHPMIGEPTFTEQILVPILERAVGIVEHTLRGVALPRLTWAIEQNRPLLRAYARLALWKLESGDPERAIALGERLYALNPHDNHGLRGVLVDEYLRCDRNADALTLANAHADDLFAETRYARVLALFRLHDLDAAHQALVDAATCLPKVLRYLLPKSIRQPKLDDGPNIIIGSAEQAWLYRQAMREEWQRTPGALAWLRKSSRRTA